MGSYLFLYANSNSPRWGAHDAITFAGKTIPASLPGIGRGVAVSHHGQWVAFAHSTSPYVTIKQASTLATISGGPTVLPTGAGYAAAFSRDDAILVIGHIGSPYITLYNTADWSKRANPATLPTADVNFVAFSPDGTKLAVVFDAAPFLLIYNTSDWSTIPGPATLPTDDALCCAWSPDGSKLAVSHYGATYFTVYNSSDWSVISGSPNASMPGTCWGLCWHPDGTRLALTHSGTPYVTVFNTSDWSKQPDPTALPANEGNCIAYSPDGLWLAIGVWNTSPYHAIYNSATMEKRANLSPLPAGSVWGVAWGPLTVGRGNEHSWEDAVFAKAGHEQPYQDWISWGTSVQPWGDRDPAFGGCEQPWENCAPAFGSSDQSWADCAFVSSAVDQRYSVSIGTTSTQSYSAYVTTFIDQQWEDCSFAYKASEHGYNISIGAALFQPYSSPIHAQSAQPILYTVDRSSEQTWSILQSLGMANDQPWSFTTPIHATTEQSWNILPRTPVHTASEQSYSLSDPLVILTSNDATLLHRNFPLSFLAAEWAMAEGDTFWTGTIQLADMAGYAAIQLDDELLLSQSGTTWHFIADRKGMNRSGANTPTMTVSIISTTAKQSSPRAALLTRTWETSTLASAAAQEAAGTFIQWDLVDWLLPPNTLAVHQADPLQTARKIVEAAGGILETLPDGTLRARHLFPVRVPDWPQATPDHILTDTRDLLSMEESHLLTRRVDSITIASREATTGFLSLSADDRPAGLNNGRSTFHPGETAFLLVIAGPGVAVDGLDASAGTTAPAGPQNWEETEELIFDNTNQATLRTPAIALTTTWHGRSLGSLTLAPDGLTLTATTKGLAVATVRYTVRAIAYSLTLPPDLGADEDVSITVRASGTESTPSDAIICQRGNGTHPGDPILEPLLNGLPSLLSRGRAEIDTGEPLRSIRLDTHFQGTILPGQLVEIQESQTSTTWRGKVTSTQHRITPTQSTTSLELMRHVSTAD